MGAFVDHKFRKGFLLDEERLRKLNDMLLTRGEQLPNECKPTYKVYRADGLTYTTEDIQQILCEDNADWQRVVRLVVSMQAEDDLSLELDFDEQQTTLHIEGNDRDLVFLVFSDLKQYLANEVFIIRQLPSRIGYPVTSLSLLAFLIYFVWALTMRSGISTISHEAALSSQDLV